MLRVQDLSKSYGGVPALAGVSLDVQPGEIHALLGPNGAGKSTLIRCVTGGIVPDSGSIEIDGRVFADYVPREAEDAGVATIHQHLSLIDSLDVADNLFLGRELRRGPLRRQREQRALAAQALADLGEAGAAISPTATVAELSIPQRQLVEITKALRRDFVRVLILDEPTAALTAVEAQALLERLRSLRAQGLHILYTTHFIHEVFELADRITVIRDGRVVLGGVPVSETDPKHVISLIVGPREEERVRRTGATPVTPRTAPPLLRVRGLESERFGPLSLDLHAGERVGIFGLLGSGRTELLETLFGVRAGRSGTVQLGGADLAVGGPLEAIERGIVLVPGDRLRQGIFPTLSALDNLLLPSFGALAAGGWLRRFARERATFAQAARNFRLDPPRRAIPAGQLSGGNQQKLVVGRWLSALERVKVVLLDEPTRGIDVGARADIYELLASTAAAGKGVLFTSSDPEEVVAAADSGLVLYRGRIVAEFTGGRLTEEALLHAAQSEKELLP